MATSSASRAPGATIAVGCISGMYRLVVHDHGGKHRFRHQSAVDLCPALEFPDIASMPLLVDMDMQHIAGKYRLAEAGIVDAHEIDKLALGFRPERVDDQHRRRLRHRLDEQHPRHHRARRKMPLEI